MKKGSENGVSNIETCRQYCAAYGMTCNAQYDDYDGCSRSGDAGSCDYDTPTTSDHICQCGPPEDGADLPPGFGPGNSFDNRTSTMLPNYIGYSFLVVFGVAAGAAIFFYVIHLAQQVKALQAAQENAPHARAGNTAPGTARAPVATSSVSDDISRSITTEI